MVEDILNAKSSRDIEMEIAKKVVIRRKELGLTQATLSRKSGVSYGSIKCFESKGEISLLSLIKISFASIAKEMARNILSYMYKHV